MTKHVTANLDLPSRLKEDTVTLPTHLLAPMNEEVELLDQQFDRAWDAGVEAAWVVVSEVLGSGPALDEITRRFVHELEMKEPR